MADDTGVLQYDSILCQIGEFGRYQKRTTLIFLAFSIINGIHACAIVFKTTDMPFRCAVPGLINDTFHVRNEDHGRFVNASIPYDVTTGLYSECKIFNTSFNGSDGSRGTTDCNSWVYDPQHAASSLVADMDVVCQHSSLKAHFNMVVLLGLLIGSTVGGTFADVFGRRTAVISSFFLQACVGVCMAYVQSPLVFLLLQFLVLFLNAMSFQTAYVLVSEVVGPKRRTVATNSTMIGFSLGMLVVALVNFLAQDWRASQIIVSAPGFASIALWWFMLESPRWLLIKKRTVEAEKVIRHIAKVNGVPPPDNLALLYLLNPNGEQEETGLLKLLWHLCSRMTLVIRITILAIGWCACTMVYYGLTLNVGTLIEGDVYMNFTILALIEFISYVLCTFFMENVNRKKIYCGSLIIAGLACLGSTGAIFSKSDEKWINLCLFAVGKFGIGVSFCMVFIVTAELLPTGVRNSGLGFCSSVGRGAGVISTYIALLGDSISEEYGKVFPLTTFGLFALAAGLFTIFLPETRNRKLPESINDAKNLKENIGRHPSRMESSLKTSPMSQESSL